MSKNNTVQNTEIRERIARNIRFALKNAKIKIGEAEAKAELTPGYLSRIEAGKVMLLPPMELVIATAELTGVSTDALLLDDLTGLYVSDMTLLKLLRRLKYDTYERNIDWHPNDGKYHTPLNDDVEFFIAETEKTTVWLETPEKSRQILASSEDRVFGTDIKALIKAIKEMSSPPHIRIAPVYANAITDFLKTASEISEET